MPLRTRYRDGFTTGSRTKRATGEVLTYTSRSFYQKCEDVVGNYGGENVFALRTGETTGGRMTGSDSRSIATYRSYTNFRADRTSTAAYPAAPSSAYLLNFSSAAYARTGVDRPEVNLPLFFVELKDVPLMLKHAGDLFFNITRGNLRRLSSAQNIASSTLAYQFGIAPIISDLGKVINFSLAYEKRVRSLNKAFNSPNGGFGRRSLINNQEAFDIKRVPVHSGQPFTYYANETTRTSERVWCTTRWRPRAEYLERGLDAAKQQLMLDMLGLNKRNITVTAWKAFPWTWFTDWFANISDTLQSINNSVNFEPVGGCIMCHRETEVTWPGTTVNTEYVSVTLSDYSNLKESKNRLPIGPPSYFPPVRVPFMDSYKLSVLGSLAVLKGLR